MQTFLPYPSFAESLSCLDNKRLGKQRVEAYQIANTLLNFSDGWKYHPAVRMWRTYELPLIEYGITSCVLWQRRGFSDIIEGQLRILKLIAENEGHKYEVPYWIGNSEFHESHQSNLLRKDPAYYEVYGWTVPNDLPYFWPKERVHATS